ncbi:MAG: aminopeptidase P family protein [Eggerthellaceae bacterium]|nr:aminopeptidase P family protein [Eggerthellaceae bacterium]
MTASVSETRLARLRSVIAERGMDAFYVRDISSIQWLTAFDGVFDGEPAHALYVDPQRAVLHTDSRYSTACEAAAVTCGGAVAVDSQRKTHAEFAFDLWVSREAGELGAQSEAQLGFGIEDSIRLAEYRKLTSIFGNDQRFVETDGLVLGLRSVKDADEVRRMKAAQAITDAAFAHIVSFMKPGMTEREVQLELEGFMLRHGAEGLAFSSIVATGANGANPHAIPGSTRLEAGQCVVLDFGARALGYCSDMTRMVFLGQPDLRMSDAYAVLRCANEEVQAFLRPGVVGKEAHELAERILAEGGYAGKMGHGLGHGVGMEVHEEPVLAPRNGEPLAVGNVVTVEPGIYLPGDFGMRLEDFGIITESGFERFTQSTHDMVVI